MPYESRNNNYVLYTCPKLNQLLTTVTIHTHTIHAYPIIATFGHLHCITIVAKYATMRDLHNSALEYTEICNGHTKAEITIIYCTLVQPLIQLSNTITLHTYIMHLSELSTYVTIALA